MKADQQKYAMERIRLAQEAKLAALKRKHTRRAKEPADSVKMNAIRNQVVFLKRSASLNATLRDAFDFSSLAKPEELDADAYGREAEKVRAEASKIRDEIMLGDEKKAIEMIRKFAG